MSRIVQALSQLSIQGRKGLTPFITTGDPYPEMAVDLMRALVKGSSNVIELGVLFSGPMADGLVIQRTFEHALAKKVDLHTMPEYVRVFRTTNSTTPMVLMGYVNPIKRMGVEAFAKATSEAGVDGVLVADYPPEECGAFVKTIRAAGVDPIFLLAPTSTEAHIVQIARMTGGYIYYVSLKGVTGTVTIDLDVAAVRIPQIRQHARLPAGVGLGIRGVTTVRAISGVANAVIIGSRVVQSLEETPRERVVQYLADFIVEIHQALDA